MKRERNLNLCYAYNNEVEATYCCVAFNNTCLQAPNESVKHVLSCNIVTPAIDRLDVFEIKVKR